MSIPSCFATLEKFRPGRPSFTILDLTLQALPLQHHAAADFASSVQGRLLMLFFLTTGGNKAAQAAKAALKGVSFYNIMFLLWYHLLTIYQ